MLLTLLYRLSSSTLLFTFRIPWSSILGLFLLCHLSLDNLTHFLSLTTIHVEILLSSVLSPCSSPELQVFFSNCPRHRNIWCLTWLVIFSSKPGLPPRLPISVKSHHYPTFAEVRKLSVIVFTFHLPSLTWFQRPFKTWFLPLFPAPFLLIQPPSLHLTDHSLQILERASSLPFSVFPVSSCFFFFLIVPITVIFSIPCLSPSSTLLTYQSVLILNVTSFENTSLHQIKPSCWHSYFPQT